MKKLILLFFVLGSMPMICDCWGQPPMGPKMVISLADLALDAKILGANPKELNAKWLSEVQMLKDMDRTVENQAEGGKQSKGYKLMAMSCCSCGTGCCQSCDTLFVRSYMATSQVNEVSVVSESTDISAAKNSSESFTAKNVDGLKVFTLDKKIPDGRYLLKIETSLPVRTISFPIDIKGRQLTLVNTSGLK